MKIGIRANLSHLPTAEECLLAIQEQRATSGMPGPMHSGTSRLDPAAITDEVVLTLPAEQVRVNGNGARKPSERSDMLRTAHGQLLRTVTSNTALYPAFSPVFTVSTSTLDAAHFVLVASSGTAAKVLPLHRTET